MFSLFILRVSILFPVYKGDEELSLNLQLAAGDLIFTRFLFGIVV